ncbi:MAG: ABC transporter ATP-binding protein [Nanoarchaeota archaeon]|nr:ABC transporter ATP-binding protein [Nanoarchaeota archaeon]MBU2520223.1 ABC transporter ATP-binding protein [Nanoarchaeota archaeon]
MTIQNVIEMRKVEKIYNQGLQSEIKVLKDIDLKIKEGEIVAIMGPSGSGKTTLLDIMGCLMKPTSGEVLIDGREIEKMDDDELAHIRGSKLGFIFQQYNLINTFTALENVEFAIRINGKSKDEARRRAVKLLKLVGLEYRLNNKPGQLSGGEQQRVAVARALANNPKVILGDELTGNLDTKTGEMIINLIKDLNKRKGYTIVIVTHDHYIGKQAERIIKLKDGEIIK